MSHGPCVRALKVHTQKMTELFVAADENGNGRLDQATSTFFAWHWSDLREGPIRLRNFNPKPEAHAFRT